MYPIDKEEESIVIFNFGVTNVFFLRGNGNDAIKSVTRLFT